MAEKRFSELTTAGAMTGAELLAMSQETLGSLLSVKSTLQNIANWFAVNSQYASALDTSNKTLCGAINELRQFISLIPQFSIEVVQTLPTEDISETTIYLVPNSAPEQGNYYEEYIYVNNTWELVGTTAVDLSAYYTKLEVDGLLAAKANTSDVTAALALKEAKADLDDDVTDIVVGLTDEQTTAPGNPVTLTTVQEGGAKSALVTFTPKQSGTGDPSPSNIRPISGWDGLSLARTGKNLFDILSYPLTSNYFISGVSGSAVSNTGFSATLDFIPCDFLKGKTVTLNKRPGGNNAGIAFYSSNTAESFISGLTNSNISPSQKWTFTVPENANYFRFSQQDGATNIQIEYGETATDFVPFQGIETHTATFPDTIMGGSYDFVSGERSKMWEYIARYNGETLPGEWMSDRDVYAEGTTPTTGAEVAYVTATPTPITLTPADVNLLKGSNTVWTDGDTVQVKYSELPNGNLGAVIDYIKQLEARIAALES